MKKTVLLLLTLCMTKIGLSQSGWTKMTNAGPISTFTSNGFYKGAAWVDVNNDGLIDLFAMPHFLFMNMGSGIFVQRTNANINTSHLQNPGGCSWGDINNDGLIDFITAQNPSEIYLNNGDTTFKNITTSIPELNGYAAWGCALADINLDNRLDLLYAQAGGFHPGATPYPCKLFIQNGSAVSFNQKKGYVFTDSIKPYTVPYFHDYDRDGDMDVFIATGPGGSPGSDYCYKNMKKETGKDTLYKMITEPWTTELQDGQCYNFVDVDNDDDFDLCLTNYAGAASRFYENTGAGNYAAKPTTFTTTGQKLSNCWGDYDNDGDLDVIISYDNSPLQYFRNDDGAFVLLSNSIQVPTGSSAVVNADYDNDGDLDVFVHGQGNARSLWRNDTVAQSRKWINIRLKGTVSNVSAIGAIIRVKAKIKGKDVWQLRQVNAQNSFQSQNDLRLHVGLSDAEKIDSIYINWPSGIKEVYTNVFPNQFLKYTEGDGTPAGIKHGAVNWDEEIKVYPNPSAGEVFVNLQNWENAGSIKVYNVAAALLFEGTIKEKSFKIPMNNLEKGQYYILLEYKGMSILRKIVISK